MTKVEFTLALHKKLSSLPMDEVEERLAFYLEIIDDRMEEGLSEEEAVAAVGSVEEIAAQILADIPVTRLIKEKIKSQRKRPGWEILLLILGSPLWLSLGIAGIAVALSLYISLWAVIISLWAAFGSLVIGAFSGIAAGIILGFTSAPLTGVALAGGGLVCAGLAIFLFYGCKAATKGTLLLPKKLFMGRKRNE